MRIDKRKLEKLMLEKKIYTYKELAERIGVSRSALSTKLNSKQISPRSKVLRKLLEFFNVDSVDKIVR